MCRRRRALPPVPDAPRSRGFNAALLRPCSGGNIAQMSQHSGNRLKMWRFSTSTNQISMLATHKMALPSPTAESPSVLHRRLRSDFFVPVHRCNEIHGALLQRYQNLLSKSSCWMRRCVPVTSRLRTLYFTLSYIDLTELVTFRITHNNSLPLLRVWCFVVVHKPHF